MSKQSRKGQLEATQQTVKFLETLLRVSADGILITDAMQNIIIVNESFCNFFERKWREVVGTNLCVWLEQFDEGALQRWAKLEKCVRHKDACSGAEFRMMGKEGARYLSVNASLLKRIRDEEIGVIISIWHDITEHKNAEAKLKEMLEEVKKSHDKCASVLNMLRLGTIAVDQEGLVKFVNENIERLTGKSQKAVQGARWEDLIVLDKHNNKDLKQMLSGSPSKRKKLSTQVLFRKNKRHYMDIEVKDEPGNPDSKMILLYDMSEIHDLRRMLDKKTQFYDLIGKSKQMQDVYQRIRDVSSVDWTVLIEGETGAGKELVAQAIHFASHRKDKPFIPVNCAGLTDSLLNSQLFGHKRGAFTGAVADQEGLFEAANGGTIFLDEIGDIPISVQTKLLRVLQEREITRVGEAMPRKVDVRILVATNRDIAEEAEEGRFRKDLLYRIKVIRIKIPPLCQRREDIPLLVTSFLAESRVATGKAVEEVCSNAMRCLLNYSWPGNVRELKSAIEYAVISCREPVIKLQDLPPELLEFPSTKSPKMLTSEDERTRLLMALEQAHRNRTRAAHLLGISRAALYRRMTKLGINPSG
jgi:PAS domain S-box-containing protein